MQPLLLGDAKLMAEKWVDLYHWRQNLGVGLFLLTWISTLASSLHFSCTSNIAFSGLRWTWRTWARLSVGCWNIIRSRSLLCCVSSRADSHWLKGAVELPLRQKGLDHSSCPAGRTHFWSQSSKGKPGPSTQAITGLALPCLPHLAHFSTFHLLQPPRVQPQLPDSNRGRRLLSKLSPPDQKRRSYGK